MTNDLATLSTDDLIAHCCNVIGVESVDELRWICEGEAVAETPDHYTVEACTEEDDAWYLNVLDDAEDDHRREVASTW